MIVLILEIQSFFQTMTQVELINLIVSTTAMLISIAAASFAFFQLRTQRRQVLLDNYARLIEINRELIAMGFDDLSLFSILEGVEGDEVKKNRYLQLWFNQIDLIFAAHRHGALDHDGWQSLKSDIEDFFSVSLVQQRWKMVSKYYRADLRKFVDEIM